MLLILLDSHTTQLTNAIASLGLSLKPFALGQEGGHFDPTWT